LKNRLPPEFQDAVGGGEFHGADLGAVGLAVTADEGVLREEQRPPLGPGAVVAPIAERYAIRNNITVIPVNEIS